jgi:hypothetical protein
VELTRRDALIALGAMGFAVGGLAQQLDGNDDQLEAVVTGAVAVSEVVFPSGVSGHEAFVKAYVSGRTQDETYSVEEVASLLTTVDREAKRATGSAFSDLEPEKRDEVLRDIGAARAYPDPDGTVPQRIRYYLINDLLFALYSSPTGGELVGNENPVGHPGGRQAYQQGPNDE